ncbi:MAG: nickel pincer cofactor biosynthesis protein LarB [Chloroflexi bacterium]|nr:nickel pincer cofactor biosynthesis protein LarB [Chloroflexota bacterium]
MIDPTGRSPFVDLRKALESADRFPGESPIADTASVRVDANRTQRTGIPEVVYAGGKSREDVADALWHLADANGRALASRVRPDDVEAIRTALEPSFSLEDHRQARAVVAFRPGTDRPTRGGIVGVMSAGTSDIPIAAEAALIAREMGSTVVEAWDVGVAGLHRMVGPLERFAGEPIDVLIVAAGMDGALPSVVAGLVDVPVIGLPTSIGYGLGAGGIGALTAMLQSCAPGLVVVNIDNGIGAGATAALIANRVADSRVDRRA